MSPRVLAFAWLASALLVAANGSAFCRSRTCDPADPHQHCDTDRNGCVRTGKELYWASSCVSFDAQADGSPKSGFDADQVTDMAKRAFATWMHADCDGGRPSIKVGSLGPVSCNESRYNETGHNANIVIFHDDDWPYPGAIDTFGLTLVRFDTTTGEIFDADVEINSADFDLTEDAGDGTDLPSILTHEFGHFLGLSHSSQADATMRAGWNGAGTDLRTLTDDDVAGICAAYPPGRAAASSCEPRHGFSGECFVPLPATTSLPLGCGTRAPANGSSGATILGGAALALLLARRRGAGTEKTCGRR